MPDTAVGHIECTLAGRWSCTGCKCSLFAAAVDKWDVPCVDRDISVPNQAVCDEPNRVQSLARWAICFYFCINNKCDASYGDGGVWVSL